MAKKVLVLQWCRVEHDMDTNVSVVLVTTRNAAHSDNIRGSIDCRCGTVKLGYKYPVGNRKFICYSR